MSEMITNGESIIIRGYLQGVSEEYRFPQYMANDVAPIIGGLSPKVKVPKVLKGAWNYNDAGYRMPNTAAPQGSYTMGTYNLDTKPYAYGTVISDETLKFARQGLIPTQPEIMAMKFMAKKIDLLKEVNLSTLIAATNWNSIGVGGEDAEGHWGDSTAASDTFLADVDKADNVMIDACGQPSNYILMDWVCWNKIKIAPALLGKIYATKFGRDMTITQDSLMEFMSKKLIVAGAIQNTAEQTAAGTEWSAQKIWGSNGKGMAFLYYRPETPSLEDVSALYQYRLRQDSGGDRLITKWRNNAAHGWSYDTQEDTDIAVVNLDCGYMFKDTATT